MKAQDFMNEPRGRCTPETSLREVARLMVDCDCGVIPVVESQDNLRLVGLVTDRDIVVRLLAAGVNPLERTAGDCMSTPIYSALPGTDEREIAQMMEEHQVRRIPVVDEKHNLCGIVSQADIARKAAGHETAEVLREVSQPTAQA